MNRAVLFNTLRRRMVVAANNQDPATFIATFNAAKAIGGNGGMTLYGLHIPLTGYQTVNPVTTGSNIAGGQSTSGFLKSDWQNFLNPGAGLGAIPTAARPFGAPCTVDGYMRDAGMVIPGTLAALASSIGPLDTTAANPNTWPNSLLTNRNCGMTIFGVTKLVASTLATQLGETAGADTVVFGGDIVSSYEALRDPAAGHWPGAQNTASGGSLPVTFDISYIKTSQTNVNNGYFSRIRFGRDIILDQRPSATNPNLAATGRNLYIMNNGAININGAVASNELRCLGYGSGRMNLAQTIIWNNWVEAQTWCPANLWKDNRPLVWWIGNSFIQPFDIADPTDIAGASYSAHISRGYDGAAPLGVCFVNVARSGNWLPSWQGQLGVRCWEDCDFVNRPWLYPIEGEWINGSSFQMNYDTCDLLHQLKPGKVKVAIYDMFYGNASEKATAIPAWETQINAEAVQLGHADTVIHCLNTAAYKTWAWGNGIDIGTDPVNGQQPEYWGGQHPTGLNCRLEEQPFRLGIRRMKGDNTVNIPERIDASVENVTLDASTVQTFLPTWTAVDYFGNTVAGVALTFTTSNSSVATVAADGTITARGSGRATIIAKGGDAIGAMIVLGTGTAPIPTPSYTAIYDFSIPGNLYQDTARTSLVTADGQSIASPTDTTGNGNHGTQSTAGRRPVWKANIQNGLGAALFDRSLHQHWLLPQSASPTSQMIVLAAVNPDAASATLRFIMGRSFSTDEIDITVNAAHKFFCALNLSGGAKNVTSTNVADGAWHILEFYYDGASLTIRIDGADVHSTAGSGTITYPNGNDIFAIGAQVLSVDTPASEYQGYIGEIRYIKDQLIGASDLSTFRHQMGTKWGITVS